MVKRKHISEVDWPRAVAKVMASSKDLKTQGALAKKSGVAQSTIGRILRGETDPQSGNLERIAKAFNMSLAKLAETGQEGEPGIERVEKSVRAGEGLQKHLKEIRAEFDELRKTVLREAQVADKATNERFDRLQALLDAVENTEEVSTPHTASKEH